MVGVMKEFSFKNLGHAGRLGNQLWQIAWTIGQSVRHNGSAVVLPSWEYRPFFSVPEKLFAAASTNSIDGGFDYYQELHYWENIQNLIWQYFQPSDLAKQQVVDYTGSNFETMKHRGCSVHHRLGDYLKYPNHFPIPSMNYYANAMQECLDDDSETVFYIFSDSIKNVIDNYNRNPFTKELLDLDKIVFFNGTPRPIEVVDRVGTPSDYLDLFSMALCRDHIIANSTFSWWSGYLSESKSAFFPSIWFGKDPAVKNIPWRKMIPQNWSEINAN